MLSRKLVKTVAFPARSKPHMLRVSPDGKEVWVQTAEVTNAWTPDRRYSIVTNGKDTIAQVFDAKTFKEVKRLTIGPGGTNIGFSKDGKTAFIAVTGANSVAVVDVQTLALESRIKAGKEPQGLIVR